MKYLTLLLLIFGVAATGCSKKKKNGTVPTNYYQGYIPAGFVTPANGYFFQGQNVILDETEYKLFLEEAHDFANYEDDELDDYLNYLADEPAYLEVRFTSNTTAEGIWHAGVYQISNNQLASEIAIPFTATVSPHANGQLLINAGSLQFITTGGVNNWHAFYEGNEFASAVVR
ncbi:MAG: hypothetical protein K2Q26_01720 [Bdellovibrionales bacterium]|nr:hypothetical protein [Bdellovibrionales bacterium]